MRPHTTEEAAEVVDMVEDWQETFLQAVGHRMVFASDEYYLVGGRQLPGLDCYGDLAQHENGVGMCRGFEARFHGSADAPEGGPGGFFQSVDGAPAAGYRAPRAPGRVVLKARRGAPVTILTGEYGKQILEPLVTAHQPDAEVVAVPNGYFGGNIAVAGLMAGSDLASFLQSADPRRRYLLPDVCLSQGRFIDGLSTDDLPVAVEVVPADGAALRLALT
jgi:NifB/MoaA-like Fe-S oxidoreductase